MSLWWWLSKCYALNTAPIIFLKVFQNHKLSPPCSNLPALTVLRLNILLFGWEVRQSNICCIDESENICYIQIDLVNTNVHLNNKPPDDGDIAYWTVCSARKVTWMFGSYLVAVKNGWMACLRVWSIFSLILEFSGALFTFLYDLVIIQSDLCKDSYLFTNSLITQQTVNCFHAAAASTNLRCQISNNICCSFQCLNTLHTVTPDPFSLT